MKININKIKEIINYEVKENPLKSNQNKALKILIYFLLIMILCTFLSRFSSSLTVPKVHVVHPVESEIVHNLNARGTIEESNEIPVTTLSGLVVASVNVNQGDTVKKGDTLLTFSKDSVNSKINEAELALKAKKTAYNRAVEDYNFAKKEIEKAKKEAELAQNEDNSSNNEESSNYSSSDSETTLIEKKRAVEDAKTDLDSDENNNLLNKLNVILNNNYELKSEINGFVTNVLAETGTTTDENPVLSMADSSSSLKFKTQIPKEEKKYIKAGEKVSLQLEDSFDIITNLTVSSITVNKDDPSMLDVTVNIPKGKGEINENAKLVLDEENSKSYLCVPIEAVRDGDNEKYVLILKKEKTALGSQIVAEKVQIQEADSNEQYYGLSDYSLSETDKVITSSNKEVLEGDVVREVDD